MEDKKREDWGFLTKASQTGGIASQMKDMVSGQSNGEDITWHKTSNENVFEELDQDGMFIL